VLPRLVEAALAAGLIVVCAAESPAGIRELAGPDRFLEFSGEPAQLLAEMEQRGILRRDWPR
jgi:hypothetical protein